MFVCVFVSDAVDSTGSTTVGMGRDIAIESLNDSLTLLMDYLESMAVTCQDQDVQKVMRVTDDGSRRFVV